MDDKTPQHLPPPPRAVGPSVPLIPQLPPHGNTVDRLGQHTRGLVDDVKEWVDLRIQLLQAEIRDQIKGKVNELVFKHFPKILPIVLGALSGYFVLMALAFGIGALLGHPVWGFLIVGLLLGAGAFGLYKYYQREAPLNPRSPHHPGNPDHNEDKNG